MCLPRGYLKQNKFHILVGSLNFQIKNMLNIVLAYLEIKKCLM